jgi:hypothetical protein
VLLQHRDHGVRHRDRAGVTRLDLRVQNEGRGPRDVRARHRLDVRARVRAVGDGRADDPVVGVVVLDLIDAVSVPVVRVQHRFMPVRALRIALEGCRAHPLPRQVQAMVGPGRVMALDALDERGIGGVLVDVDARWGLVHDVVRHEAMQPDVGPRVCGGAL